MNRNIRRLARLACEMAERHGRPQDARRVSAACSGDTLTVHLDSEHLKDRHLTVMGAGDLADEIDADAPQAQHLRARISEMLRVEARHDVLEEHGAQRPPAWSVCIPRLFDDLLARVNLDVALVVDHLIGRSLDDMITPRDDVTLRNVSVQSGRLEATITFHRQGEACLEVVAGGDEDGHCMLRIPGTDLAETIMTAAVGMRLSDMLDHEDVNATRGLNVAHVRRRRQNGAVETIITLSPDFVWGGTAPPDVNLSWRDVREGCLLPEG